MPQKVCPRCGSLFASLKSATCPQCFARLETLDDETAAELTAVRSRIESTREYQDQKEREDEAFRHESFRACLTTIAIGFAVIIFSIVVIGVAFKRQQRAVTAHHSVPPPSATLDLLTPRPAENATIESVFPSAVGQYRVAARDQQATLSGTLTQVYHGRYVSGRSVLDAYAISGARPATELEGFRDAMTLTAGLGPGTPKQVIQFRTEHWHYAVMAETATDLQSISKQPVESASDLVKFRDDLGQQFSVQ